MLLAPQQSADEWFAIKGFFNAKTRLCNESFQNGIRAERSQV
jgi:hypothetical protein